MQTPQRYEQRTPSRAPWVVPLAFGVGGTLAIIFMILVGIGYDLVGRTPGPIVITGLALLSAPMLYIARSNFRDYQGRARIASLSPELTQVLVDAMRRHGESYLEESIFALVRQLDRQRGRQPSTAVVHQLSEGDSLDDEDL